MKRNGNWVEKLGKLLSVKGRAVGHLEDGEVQKKEEREIRRVLFTT